MLTDWTFYARFPPSATLDQFDFIATAEGDLVFEDVKQGEDRYHRRFCRTEFTVYGLNYSQFDALRVSDPCDEIEFVAQYAGVTKWEGRINLKKVKWFPDRCEFKFTPEPDDSYLCVFRNWETEKNVLSIGSPISAEPFFGTLTEVTCGPVNQATAIEVMGYFEANVNACLSGNDAAYVIKRAYIEEITPGSSYDHYATWVTEQAVTACVAGSPVPPPGDGWVLLVNDCAGSGNATYGRPPQLSYAGEFSATSGKYWDNRYDVVGEDVTEYPNGRLLSAVLESFASDCSLTVVSDFFDINPDASAPSNDAYTASVALHTLLIYQKSDVKRPDSSNPATFAPLKFRDLLEVLRQMFAVYWRLEGSDLRIEHASYFEGANGEDLTSTQPELVADRNAFTYDTDKLAPREEFAWMDTTYDTDFFGQAIIYPLACADPDQEPVKYTVKDVFTDLGTVGSNPDNVSDQGFFFLATDLISGVYYVNRETGELSNDIKANAHLSWANLHENYLRWDRLQASGTLNNVDQLFESYRRSRRQQPIVITLDADDYFALDLTDKLNTELGWGEISKGTWSARACKYTVEILHDD